MIACDLSLSFCRLPLPCLFSFPLSVPPSPHPHLSLVGPLVAAILLRRHADRGLCRGRRLLLWDTPWRQVISSYTGPLAWSYRLNSCCQRPRVQVE